MPRTLVLLALALLGAAESRVTAQFTPTPVLSSATLNLDGCSTVSQVNSWSWAESNATTSAGAGKVNFENLSVVKPFDACSHFLESDAATGNHIATVTLTEYDLKQTVLMTMVLTPVYVADYEIDGATSTAAPSEHVSLTTDQVKITYPTSTGNIVFCYNVKIAQSC